MAALIKLRQKPQKPRRKEIKLTFDLYEGASFADAMQRLGCEDPSQIMVEKNYDCDYPEIIAYHSRMQTDDEFRAIMDRYQEQKKKYDSWFSANEMLIRKEIQRRKTEALMHENAAKEKARKRLKKELAKLEKEIG